MHQKVCDAAGTLLDFGYHDLIEANLTTQNVLFSAPLRREFLRETESLIIHKYSRNTQREFSVLGVVTQQGARRESEPTPPDVKDTDGIKHAMRTLAEHLRVLENQFAAPMPNEIILDPIAIYSEL
jgi:hypothetical protein